MIMQQFTEGIEKVYTDLTETYGDQQDQQIFDILSDMEADIETGNVSQEEIVDKVADAIVVTTELGVKIEEAVEKFFFQLGLDSIPADRRSRDYRDQKMPGEATDRIVNAKAVPDQVEGQPYVHTDDDFLLFLEWLIRQEDENGEAKYTARSIVDVISKPYKEWVVELYQTYLAQKDKQVLDPLL
jgi:hypothetical protein